MHGPGTRVWMDQSDRAPTARERNHVTPARTHPHRRHHQCGMHPAFWVLGILLFTAGALAVAIAAAVITGLWVLSYLLTRPVRRRLHRPARVVEPWRALDDRAVRASKRYATAVQNARPGPLRQRLGDLQKRVEGSTKSARRVARRGRDLDALVHDGGPNGDASAGLLDDLHRQLTQRVEGLEAAASVAVELTLRVELEQAGADTGDVAAQLAAVIDALDTVEDADRV